MCIQAAQNPKQAGRRFIMLFIWRQDQFDMDRCALAKVTNLKQAAWLRVFSSFKIQTGPRYSLPDKHYLILQVKKFSRITTT